MDKKEARKILGVTKETSRNDIERKYSIFLKKQRMKEQQDGEQESETDQTGAASQAGTVSQGAASVPPVAEKQEEYSFEQVTQAYNVLMGYEVTIKEAPPSKAAPLLKKAGIDEKKAQNFFYYHKIHILAAVLAVISIILIARSCANQEKPDFNIAFVGRIAYTDAVDKLDAAIKAGVPEIKEPGFDGAYVSEEDQGEQAYAMVMKATVLFAAAEIDVFILDKASYIRYAKNGAFMSLDEIAPRLGADMEKNKENIVQVVETDIDTGKENPVPGTEHLYGIDVTNSTALKDAGVLSENFIAAIFVNSKNSENAVKLLQFLMK